MIHTAISEGISLHISSEIPPGKTLDHYQICFASSDIPPRVTHISQLSHINWYKTRYVHITVHLPKLKPKCYFGPRIMPKISLQNFPRSLQIVDGSPPTIYSRIPLRISSRINPKTFLGIFPRIVPEIPRKILQAICPDISLENSPEILPETPPKISPRISPHGFLRRYIKNYLQELLQGVH